MTLILINNIVYLQCFRVVIVFYLYSVHDVYAMFWRVENSNRSPSTAWSKHARSEAFALDIYTYNHIPGILYTLYVIYRTACGKLDVVIFIARTSQCNIMSTEFSKRYILRFVPIQS